jgi:hypothetical protein
MNARLRSERRPSALSILVQRSASATSLAIGQKALGSNHTLTQRYASHYPRLLLDIAPADEALPLAQTALATHETALGANHPWTKESARVTADALAALGCADEGTALRGSLTTANEHGVAAAKGCKRCVRG